MVLTPSTEDAEASITRAKRAKIALACEECRARKVRCDGAQPVCGACSRRRKKVPNCTYKQERTKDGISIGYVANLESRLHELEALNQKHSITRPLSDVRVRSRQAQRRPVQSVRHERQFPVIQPSTNRTLRSDISMKGSPSSHHARSHQQIWSSSEVHLLSPESVPVQAEDLDEQHTSLSEPNEGNDGMGNTGIPGKSFATGTSSAASFMKQIRDAVSANLSIPAEAASRGATINIDPFRSSSNDHNSWFLPRFVAEHCVLPARNSADRMLDVYWEQVHVLYPFLHHQQFLQAYENLWTSNGPKVDNRMVYCILNVVFAISCKVTKKQRIEEQEGSADVFFQRGLQLLQIDMIGAGSLSLIQALLLVSQYLQSSEWPHRCWTAVGLAVRVAQGLGLHLPETTARIKIQRDRELARRLWHGCVFMDRMAAMTLGRPVMISRQDALLTPFPSSIDDEHLSLIMGHDGIQPRDQPSTIAFFVHSVDLYGITERVLSAMYPSGSVNAPFPRSGLPLADQLEGLDFDEILRLDRDLIKWKDSLPPFLVINPGVPVDYRLDPVFPRQANILRLRYLHLKILLFRPLLSLILFAEFRSLSACSDTGLRLWLPQAMALLCAKKCVFAAQKLIDVVYDNQVDDNDVSSVEPLPVWWYQVFFVYTAATALIPARLYSQIQDEFPKPSLLLSWERALLVLRRLGHLSVSSRRCLAALELLDDKVVNITNQDGPETQSATSERAVRADRATNNPSEFSTAGLSSTTIPGYEADQGPDMDFLSFMPAAFDQDNSWLDSISLPTDLLNMGYGELPELYSG